MAGRFGWFGALRGNLLGGFERFPVSLVALACFVTLINLEIAGIRDLSNAAIVRLGAASGAAAAIAAAAVLFGERRGSSARLRHGISLLLACAAAVAILFWEALGVAPPALLVATVLAVPLAPYLRGGLAGFWAFIWQLVHAGALAFIAVIVFCLGISAILVSLQYLFGLRIDETLYGHVWSIGLGFVGPLFALSLVPSVFPAEDMPEGTDIVMSGVRTLADFVAVPLLATYAVILHAYALKILAAGELPNNQIGWMVLSFGLCVLSLRMLAHPLAASGRLPTRLFLRWWAIPLVVPLGLLVSAVSLRIAAYGVTPERYGLALFALFLGLVLLAQLPRRLRGDIRVIPALGAVCLFFASFGAWGILSASAVSQASRLTAHLDAAGVLDGGRLAAAPALEPEAAAEIRSIVSLLDTMGQLDRLGPLFAGRPDDPFGATRAAGDDGLARAVQTALGANASPDVAPPEGVSMVGPGAPVAIPIAGFDVIVPGLAWTNGPASVLTDGGDFSLSVEFTPDNLVLAQGSERLLVSREELRRAITGRIAEARPPGVGLPPLLVDLTLGNRRIGVLVEGLTGSSGGSDFRIESSRMTLLLRRADWGG